MLTAPSDSERPASSGLDRGGVAAAEANDSLPPAGSHTLAAKGSPAGRRSCARRETVETPWTSGQRREAAALPQRALSAWLNPHAPRRDAHPCSGAGHSPAVQTHGAASRVAPAVQRAHAATSPAGPPLAVLRCGCLRRSGPHQGPGRAGRGPVRAGPGTWAQSSPPSLPPPQARPWVEQRCAIRICLQSVRR